MFDSNFVTRKDMVPTFDNIKVGNKNAISIGVKGARHMMEDRSIMFKLELPDHYLFAIFDGHCGSNTAIILGKYFHIFFQNQQGWKDYVSKKKSQIDDVATVLSKKPLSRENSTATEIDLDAAILEEWTTLFTKIFVDFDEQLFSLDKSNKDGATAVVVLMTPDSYICASVGDSEAAIIDDGSYKLSINHKPDMIEEKRRIEASGGGVYGGRVNGNINISRSFGDFNYKKMDVPEIDPADYTITVVPTVKIFPRKSEDKYLVLACDGLWDTIINGITINDTLIVDDALIEETRHNDLKQHFEQVWLSKQPVKSKELINGVMRFVVPIDYDEDEDDENYKGYPIYELPEYSRTPLKPFNSLNLLGWQATKMIDFAIAKGSLDNISIIIVEL
jgi:serine/threonine protein phosphatase PrpC